jgi:hypothetical protein
MNYFNKLIGFQRSPSGMEWHVWRKLPLILLVGTALPLLFSVCAYALNALEATTNAQRAVAQFFYVMLGIVIFHWMMVLTLAIGCAIVIVMKGPAYVADAYNMEEPQSDTEKTVQR